MKLPSKKGFLWFIPFAVTTLLIATVAVVEKAVSPNVWQHLWYKYRAMASDSNKYVPCKYCGYYGKRSPDGDINEMNEHEPLCSEGERAKSEWNDWGE